MAPEGGKRDRMVWASMYEMLRDGLDDLGWLDDPTTLEHEQVSIVMEPFPDGEPIPLNTVVVMAEDIDHDELETGSNAERGDRTFLVDIYAENHQIGQHLRGDISAMLRGHLPSIGRDQAKLDVYDYEQATPPIIAVCDIVNVRDARATSGSRPWEQCWYEVMCVVEDEEWVL